MRTLAALALALGTAMAPAAQFRVVSSSPADGATAVPLSDTLRFSFSQPIAAGAPPAVASFPADQVTFGPASASADGLTVSYPVSHVADTRYVHLVLEAQASDGSPLERPFAVAYTTAGSAGPLTVTGTVSAARGTVDASVVALLGVGATGATIVDAMVLSGTGGSYSLGPVPLGVYSVGAVRLPHVDPDRSFAYGFYDPDGDGTPNPVVVPFGVNLTMSEPAPVLARSRLAAALAQAQTHAADAALYELAELPVDTTGRSPFWRYVYYSAAQDSTIEVVETGLIPIAFVRAGQPASLAPIVGTWVDSDVALAAAEGAGGAQFRVDHAGQPQVLTLRAGLQPDVPTDATPCYRVAYRALDAGGTPVDSFIVYVSMPTGQVIFPTAVEPGSQHVEVSLEAPAPNPAGGAVTVAFTLSRPAGALLEVFDAAGRRVAVLADGPRAAGRYSLVWDADGLAPGVYLLRLRAGGADVSRSVVVRR